MANPDQLPDYVNYNDWFAKLEILRGYDPQKWSPTQGLSLQGQFGWSKPSPSPEIEPEIETTIAIEEGENFEGQESENFLLNSDDANTEADIIIDLGDEAKDDSE